MKFFRFALQSLSDGVSHRFHQPHTVRTLSTNALSESVMDDDKQKSNSFESTDDFESRIFGENSVGNSKTDASFAKAEKLTKTSDGFSSNLAGSKSGFHALEGLDESFSTLSDGMDGKLKRAATDFQFDSEEVQTDGYNFRPDISFQKGGTYELKDLDLTKPGVRKPVKRVEFETTTEEVLRKADFRNVRFLANFITEAGVINKRSKFKISAKAQRRVAREIKTARAFGLMPFTSMGTKSFAFGKTMENLDKDFQYESYDNPADDDERNPLGY